MQCIVATVLTYCVVTTFALTIDDVETLEKFANDRHGRHAIRNDPDSDTVRKLLLKKLRFREILRENMLSPEEILQSTQEKPQPSSNRHKVPSKRYDEVNDLVSRVRALLTDIKERQIKESMSLPSLRFGRSGLNYRHRP